MSRFCSVNQSEKHIKKFDEEENEDFCEDEYFNFEDLSFTELKIDFRKNFFVSKS